LSNNFYQRFLPSISEGIYPINSSEFNTLLSGLIVFGDSFLATVQQHVFENGSISEEFDRYVPTPILRLISGMMDILLEHGI